MSLDQVMYVLTKSSEQGAGVSQAFKSTITEISPA